MKWLSKGFLTMVASIAALQLVPGPAKQNPPVQKEHMVQAHVNLPPAASKVLEKSCFNCHSNETRWPWYSRIAPVSWFVAKDVDKARRTMNFSEWSVQNGRKPETAIAAWQASCLDLQKQRMPTNAYMMLHPEARVSPEEVKAFCAWTQQETVRLIQVKRQRKAASGS